MEKISYSTSDFNTAVALLTLGIKLLETVKDGSKCIFLFDISDEEAQELVTEVFIKKKKAPIIDTLNMAKQLKVIIHQ